MSIRKADTAGIQKRPERESRKLCETWRGITIMICLFQLKTKIPSYAHILSHSRTHSHTLAYTLMHLLADSLTHLAKVKRVKAQIPRLVRRVGLV